MSATVKALTQLPDQEPGHPRGPNTEYVNIILKEMGIRDSAQIEHAVEGSKPATTERPSAAALNQIMLRLGNNPGATSAGKEFKEKARNHLNKVAAEHLARIEERGTPRDPFLAQLAAQEKRASQQMPDLLMRLFRSVRGEETAIALLEKLAEQNVQQKMFAYRIDKYRDPVQMVEARNGDCQSFCTLFKMLGKAAQIEGIEQLNMEGKMQVELSNETPEIAGAAPGAKMLMARHSILQLNDGEQSRYFDPVFGKQVDPAFYGRDQARYLLRQ